MRIGMNVGAGPVEYTPDEIEAMLGGQEAGPRLRPEAKRGLPRRIADAVASWNPFGGHY